MHTRSTNRQTNAIVSIALPSQLPPDLDPNAFPAVPRLAGTEAPELGGRGTCTLGVGGSSVMVEFPSFVTC